MKNAKPNHNHPPPIPTSYPEYLLKKKKGITKYMLQWHPPICFKLDQSLLLGSWNLFKYTVTVSVRL